MKRLILVQGLVCVLVLSASLSFAQRENLIIPYTAFFADLMQPTFSTGDDWNSDGDYLYRNDNSGDLIAPIYFPPSADGKKIWRLGVLYYDNHASADLRVELYKTDFLSGNKTLVASWNSSGDTASKRTGYLRYWAMSGRGIDSNRYSWWVRVGFEDSGTVLRLYSIRIEYE